MAGSVGADEATRRDLTGALEDHPVELDLEGAVANIRRKGTPSRVFFYEHGLEPGIKDELCERFGLCDRLNRSDDRFLTRREIALYRFLGLEFMRVFPPGIVWRDLPTKGTDPPPPIGPIQTWRDFETYPWPTIDQVDFSEVEWLEDNLPDNMALWSTTHVFQWVSNLIGFAPLCTMLYENRELIRAVTARVGRFCADYTAALCDFDRVGAINVADDLGHRTGALISPDDIRELFIPWQSQAIAAARERGKVGIFHVCGHVDEIMRDLIDTVGIDAKHSTQDTIEPIQQTMASWGSEVGLLGGVDIDFATRARPAEVAAYTRRILDDCFEGGGFALGLGNWVADSVPLDNFLAMLREAREFA